MIMYAVYLITEDGRPLFSKYFQDESQIPDEALLSGLLSVIQSISLDLTKGEGTAEKFQMKGITYHLKSFGSFQVVLVTDMQDAPQNVIDKIGWRFLQTQNEKLTDWKGNQRDFEGFNDHLNEIVVSEFNVDISATIDPSKRLDTADIFLLPRGQREVALALTSLGQATIETLIDQTEFSQTEIEKYLKGLHQQGYVGVIEKDGTSSFFCLN